MLDIWAFKLVKILLLSWRSFWS